MILYFITGHFDSGSVHSIDNLRLFMSDPFSAGTSTVRMSTYHDALDIISNNFFIGAGLGTTSEHMGITIHNTFLQIFSSLGVFGFLFQVAINFIVPIYIISNMKELFLKKLLVGYIIIHFVFLMTRDFSHFDALFMYYYIIYILYCLDNAISNSFSFGNVYRILS